MIKFNIKTPLNNFDIEVYFDIIKKEEVVVNKKYFDSKCIACKNYNKKYSCPPNSPEFSQLMKDHDSLFVAMFKCNLSQIKSTPYNKIRIANACMKPRLDKLMRTMEKNKNQRFFSNGSCRLCKKCNFPDFCKHPDKMRYSLESTGVDCNNLSEKLFNISLQWYGEKKTPDYSCVLCGLPINSNESLSIIEEFKTKIKAMQDSLNL